MLFNRVLDNIEESRERRLRGEYNCIPWGLPRFEDESPGLEQEKYYITTGSTKAGKSQLTDYLFMYSPLDFIRNNPSANMDIKILYFTLEMSKEEKIKQAISRFLYVQNKEDRFAPKDLMSKKSDKILSETVLDKLKSKEIKEYFDFFESKVEFITNVRTPYGIYSYVRDYAKANGTQHKKDMLFTYSNKKSELKSVDDYYQPNNPNQYVIVIVDHASLIQKTKDHKNLWEAIFDLSSNFLVKLRNKYKYIPVLVQQQSADKESLDSLKANRLYPTLDGLADCKVTARDANAVFSIYSPYRHKIASHEGYDITKFKDHIRFMEIVASRDGGANTVCPLYFDGAVNVFKELPKPNAKKHLDKVYSYLNELKT